MKIHKTFQTFDKDLNKTIAEIDDSEYQNIFKIILKESIQDKNDIYIHIISKIDNDGAFYIFREFLAKFFNIKRNRIEIEFYYGVENKASMMYFLTKKSELKEIISALRSLFPKKNYLGYSKELSQEKAEEFFLENEEWLKTLKK